MESLLFKSTEFPDLSDIAKSRIKDGFWSLIKTVQTNGSFKFYVKAENKTFEISDSGQINKVIDNNNNKLNEPIVARLNFS